MNLKQGWQIMADFSIDFWTLAAQMGWGQDALKSALLNNVSEEVKDVLVRRELPCVVVFWIADRLRARRSTQSHFIHEPPASGDTSLEPQGMLSTVDPCNSDNRNSCNFYHLNKSKHHLKAVVFTWVIFVYYQNLFHDLKHVNVSYAKNKEIRNGK